MVQKEKKGWIKHQVQEILMKFPYAVITNSEEGLQAFKKENEKQF